MTRRRMCRDGSDLDDEAVTFERGHAPARNGSARLYTKSAMWIARTADGKVIIDGSGTRADAFKSASETLAMWNRIGINA